MIWMTAWPGDYPVFFAEARGSHVTDVDGHTYADFCLGDTGAMSGHSPEPVVGALRERAETHGGITTMLPSEDALVVGEELSRRFGPPLWQFTTSATDANRCVIRFCRQLTRRPYILVFAWCYHGSVDESHIVLDADGRPRSRPGNIGPPVDPIVTTKVVEYNDVAALERALAPRDVACVLMEPAMTNVGIVPPQPGYLEEVRRLCDETGHPARQRRDAHLVRRSRRLHRRLGPAPGRRHPRQDARVGDPDRRLRRRPPSWASASSTTARATTAGPGGIGGTLAGYALAQRRGPSDADERAHRRGLRAHDRARRALRGRRPARSSSRADCRGASSGSAPGSSIASAPRCRAPARSRSPPTTPGLNEYFHLFALNRGILITPFHNMALMCPETTTADVDLHSAVFAQAVDELIG